jgi:hypothetical protein
MATSQIMLKNYKNVREKNDSNIIRILSAKYKLPKENIQKKLPELEELYERHQLNDMLRAEQKEAEEVREMNEYEMRKALEHRKKAQNVQKWLASGTRKASRKSRKVGRKSRKSTRRA